MTNVQGPCGIPKPAVLEPGHTISNEPGFYLEGKWGIRIESIITCKIVKVRSNPRKKLSEAGAQSWCQKLAGLGTRDSGEFFLLPPTYAAGPYTAQSSRRDSSEQV